MEAQSKRMGDDSDLVDDSGNFAQSDSVRQENVIPSSSGSSSSGLQDRWTKGGARWARHHVQLRQRLFVPSSEPGGPPVDRLQPRRITRYRFADNSDGVVHKRVDEWNSEDPTQSEFLLPNFWTGTTTFSEKADWYDHHDIKLRAPPIPLDEAARSKEQRQPCKPTPTERRLHQLTHLPLIMVSILPSSKRQARSPYKWTRRSTADRPN